MVNSFFQNRRLTALRLIRLSLWHLVTWSDAAAEKTEGLDLDLQEQFCGHAAVLAALAPACEMQASMHPSVVAVPVTLPGAASTDLVFAVALLYASEQLPG